ncbi:MAG: helicase-associated domain-containing protein [Spirochaetes bacterium]|nr:helicase-associated domain-containing protein [Spirochaetota bacterium]
MSNEKPLILQTDGSLLLEVDSPVFVTMRDTLLKFAELIKSPEHIYTYRITNISLWNAASFGVKADEIIDFLKTYSKYKLPQNIVFQIRNSISRYGKVKLLREGDNLILSADDKLIMDEIMNVKTFSKYIRETLDEKRCTVDGGFRGHIKLELIRLGYPVEDLAGYIDGTPYELALRDVTLSGLPFALRGYQNDSVAAFYANGDPSGGAGTIVLPCGAGKTVVGMAVMAKIKTQTLIITTGITACRQWKNEILDKTNISDEDIGEYNGETKTIKPITIATYKIITYRKSKNDEFKHFNLFFSNKWGLIIYDEVHLLPAPIIRVTSEIQSTRRLGLTATLVREDGLETDVFGLIGPKKFDVPWRELESKQFIAEALCYDVRVKLDDSMRGDYVMSSDKGKFRISSENPAKNDIIERLLDMLTGKHVLIIGQYIDQLEAIERRFGFPIIMGKTPQSERDRLYTDFKSGKIMTLIVSKVANFAIDLPDANALIQVSGTFGSRQEEAQRLGRVLRPKPGENKSFFFSVITTDSKEEEFAHKRQLFLTEQGYSYEIVEAKDLGQLTIGCVTR